MGWKQASRITIKIYTGFIYKHSIKIKAYITKGRCLFHYMITRLQDTVREEIEPVKKQGLEKKPPERGGYHGRLYNLLPQPKP